MPLHFRNKPLIIVYQNKEQVRRMQAYGENMVFMDASYKGLTAYRYAVYCIHGKDARGHGTPLAYFIVSDENENVISKCLQALKDNALLHGFHFAPR